MSRRPEKFDQSVPEGVPSLFRDAGWLETDAPKKPKVFEKSIEGQPVTPIETVSEAPYLPSETYDEMVGGGVPKRFKKGPAETN